MLEMTEVTKKYKQTTAVKGMNLYLKKGEAVGLLGPNGAGKSTAISMLASLMPTTCGEVRLKGKNVRKDVQAFRKLIGVVPQEIALFPELSAEENLKFFGKIQKISRNEIQQRTAKLLEQVGLADHKKQKVSTFSGGMKRRLNLACGLIHAPEYLLLDEPTVGVDPQSRRHLLDMVKQLQVNEQMTVLYTSHYMEEVEFICDRLYVMDRGEVIAAGKNDEIKRIVGSVSAYEILIDQGKNKLFSRLQNDPRIGDVFEVEKGLRIATNHDDFFEELITLTREADVKVQGILSQEQTLEDVFLHLTGRKLRD